ncbi:aldo/keto reductase [Pseudomonas lijiangensis]|uniref:aldo/keto reductase n=1 Tax=Pseudomonas lijiangensis TaxID=2995658 RepID=UPI0031BB5883
MRDIAPIYRRDALKWLGIGAAASVAGTLLPSSLASAAIPAKALPQGVMTRRIPSTGEVLPAIGLGTFLTFDVIAGEPREFVRQVLQASWELGVRAIDTSPLYGTGEVSVGDYATALGIGEQMFIANKIWSTGDFLADESHALASLRQSESRLWRKQIDLMQCHSLVNVEVIAPYLKAWKKEGLIRYTGVTHYLNDYLQALEGWVEKGGLDFVQVQYSIFNRAAEQRVLPAAADKGVAVLTNMPFEKARLFKLVEGQEVPAFAREAGIRSWSHYFLKWVISHPAVTCALPATSNPAHARENALAMYGELPDKALRERMVRHIEGLPGFGDLAKMAPYPGKRYPGIIARAQGALRNRLSDG